MPIDLVRMTGLEQTLLHKEAHMIRRGLSRQLVRIKARECRVRVFNIDFQSELHDLCEGLA